MKKIHTKGALRLSIAVFGVSGVLMIILGVINFLDGEIDGCILMLIASIFLILLGAYVGLRIYLTHWIMYGNGIVVISRVSKDRVDGKAVGKWKRREDEFLLEEIVAYGLSWQALGHYVEYHYSSEGKLSSEVFFQLKNGKRIGYEAIFYTAKQTVEFWKYIQDETGIVFQNSKPT